MPINCLIFPMLLPFTRYVFFGRAVDASSRRKDNDFGAGATFGTSSYITGIRVASGAVDNAGFFRFLGDNGLVFGCFSICNVGFSLFRFGTWLFTAFFFGLLRVDDFKRSFYKVRCLAATSKDTPWACIVEMFRFYGINARAVFIRVIGLFLATRYRVAN